MAAKMLVALSKGAAFHPLLSKGEKKMEVSKNTVTNSSMVVSIYVCKGEEPFSLKAQDESKENSISDSGISASASYTIDF